MKTILKSHWNNKRVIVSINPYFNQDGFYASFRMKIKVEETHLLPSTFARGVYHNANKDVVETLGGLPNYVAKILNDAANRRHAKQKAPIREQFELF